MSAKACDTGRQRGVPGFVAGRAACKWRAIHHSCAADENCWCTAAKPRTKDGRGCLRARRASQGGLLLEGAKCFAGEHHETHRMDFAGHADLRRFRGVVGKRCGKRNETRYSPVIAKRGNHASRPIAADCDTRHRHRFRHMGRQLRRTARQRHAQSRPALQRLADLRVCARCARNRFGAVPRSRRAAFGAQHNILAGLSR